MSAFVDRYHDAYHVGTVMDLINCIHCQDAFIEREDTAARATRMENMIAAGYSGPANDNDA